MRRFISLVAMTMLAGPALAQTSPSAPPANPTVPIVPHAQTTPPEKIAPPSGNAAGANRSSGTMSNTLSRQHGTIAPPNVDPGMTIAPPRTGGNRTPVIPPPGSSGGNPTVVPK